MLGMLRLKTAQRREGEERRGEREGGPHGPALVLNMQSPDHCICFCKLLS